MSFLSSLKLPIPSTLIVNFAGMAFLGSVIYLVWSAADLSRFMGLYGILFTFFGLIIAGGLIGWPITRMHQAYCGKILAKYSEASIAEIPDSIQQRIRFTGTIIMAIQIAAVFFLTELAFTKWFVVS